ncbi:MAG: hypothetical protein RMA76_17610 [Deltaproteobacteria bacterium]|jgi:hypothetical protein
MSIRRIGDDRGAGRPVPIAIAVPGEALVGWTVREALRELGLGDRLGDDIHVAPDGTVRHQDLVTRLSSNEDVVALFSAIDESIDPDFAMQVLRDIEITRQDRFANDYFLNGDVLDGTGATQRTQRNSLPAHYLKGRAFQLARAPGPRVEPIIAEGLADDAEVAALLAKLKGALPGHPAEHALESQTLISVRTASSERSVRIPGSGMTLKLPLLKNHTAYCVRPIPEAHLQACLDQSQELARRSETLSKHFAFLPEFAGLPGDEASVLVRSERPFPPAPKETWVIRGYSLTSVDLHHPTQPPALIRMARAAQRAGHDPIAWALERIVRPLIEVGLDVHVDLRARGSIHRQNLGIELDANGPTGRWVVQDLSDLELDASVEASRHSFGVFVISHHLRTFDAVLREYYPDETDRILDGIQRELADALAARSAQLDAEDMGPFRKIRDLAAQRKYKWIRNDEVDAARTKMRERQQAKIERITRLLGPRSKR